MDLGLGKQGRDDNRRQPGLGACDGRGVGRRGCAALPLCARGRGAGEGGGRVARQGYEVDAEAVDVADPVAAERWVEGVAKRMGGIDVLVNNAGGARMGALKDLDEAAWQAAFELNFFSAVRLARLCAPLIERRGGGSIINISSIYGREAGGPLTYNASKAAMISFTKMLARELAPKGIRVNSVAPGSIFYPGGNWEKAFKANPAFEKDFLATNSRPDGWAVRKRSPTRSYASRHRGRAGLPAPVCRWTAPREIADLRKITPARSAAYARSPTRRAPSPYRPGLSNRRPGIPRS